MLLLQVLIGAKNIFIVRKALQLYDVVFLRLGGLHRLVGVVVIVLLCDSKTTSFVCSTQRVSRSLNVGDLGEQKVGCCGLTTGSKSSCTALSVI